MTNCGHNNEVFDDSCHPVELQNELLNHFLYADDLVIISQSKEGLQNCLNKVHKFAVTKHLEISISKSKSMIFNHTGRFENKQFTIDKEPIENVNSFCYLGFEVKSSGTVKHAMNILNDKAKKALRPVMTAIARFKIPVETSIRIFHTYISPILLYNVENWATLTDKNVQGFDNNSVFVATSNSKIDLVHRKFLKFILGVSKSCPNLSVYGETGETPLSLKGYRLTLNFWHRVTNLPDSVLVKKALLENINLRTNWIMTVEKLINRFDLADKIGNNESFKKATRCNIDETYQEFWKTELETHAAGRLEFYREVKNDFYFEKYLKLQHFEHRKIITKLRCSDHSLEIEKGRHRKIDRQERLCKQCNVGAIETETHFLLDCNKYDILKLKHNVVYLSTIQQFMNYMDQNKLGAYLIEAFSFRDLG